MNTKKLTRSIAVIFVLIVFIVISHLLTLLNMDKTWISMTANLILLLLDIIYCIQLRNNLNRLLLIININHKINAIIISYIVIISVIIALAIINRDNLNPKPDAIHTFLLLIFLIATLNLVVQYFILGYRLAKNASFPYVKKLGYLYLSLKPVTDFITPFLFIFSSLRMYSHLSIFSEIIPLWFVYKQYKELIAKENPDNTISFITNAALIPNENEK